MTNRCDKCEDTGLVKSTSGRLCHCSECEQEHPEPPYCDCLDIKFNDVSKEDVASNIPQPDPNCAKCDGSGYLNKQQDQGQPL